MLRDRMMILLFVSITWIRYSLSGNNRMRIGVPPFSVSPLMEKNVPNIAFSSVNTTCAPFIFCMGPMVASAHDSVVSQSISTPFTFTDSSALSDLLHGSVCVCAGVMYRHKSSRQRRVCLPHKFNTLYINHDYSRNGSIYCSELIYIHLVASFPNNNVRAMMFARLLMTNRINQMNALA